MSEKLPDPVMVCKDIANQQLKLTHSIGTNMVQTWKSMIENHPFCVMANWMSDSYIEAVLNRNQSQKMTQ